MIRTAIACVATTLTLSGAALAQQVQTQEVNASPGETLTVDLKPGGQVVIIGTDRNKVVVKAETYDQSMHLSVSRVSGGVEVRSNVLGSHRGKTGGVEIEVPRRFNARINTMGGEIHIRDVEGNLSGRTMGGGLKLERLKGDLDLTTMGGAITLTDSDVDGKLTTMGGKVLFRNVVGDVNGKSMGGNVTYDNVRRRDGSGTGKSVVISTQGGTIDVPSAPAGADVRTMGGEIRVKSAAGFVKAETMGGNIVIGDVDGWVKASTMGGDIDVNVTGSNGRHDVTLSSMGGDIRLTLPAGFDGDFEIELAYTKNSRRDYKITSDFPLSSSESAQWDYSRGSARRVIKGSGRSGSGRNKVSISTTNGDVIIRKR